MVIPENAPYRVAWSRRPVNVLKELRERAHEFGGGGELARVIKALDERLRRQPVSLGEVYRTRGTVAEHLAVYEFLAIDFAVDTERKFVLVRDCRVLSRPGR
jgi:hypothetical protein